MFHALSSRVAAGTREHFRTILLGGADGESQRTADFQPSIAVAHFIKAGSLPAGLTAQQLPQETLDSQAECDAARLVVRCMYEGKLAEERLADLHPSQLPAKQLLLVLQTLPDSCALLPEHKKWQDRVHRLAGELNALPMMLHLYGDVHAVITSAQLRTTFQQLPFAAVQQWACSDELTVDSENSVVELISLWMAGPVGKGCSWGEKEQLSCLVRVQHLSPVLIEVVASAASCGCMEGLLNKALPAWSAAPRKQLDPAELLRRTTIRLDVPRQQLVYLLASEDLTAEEFWGELSFLDKSLATAADLDPFLEDGCLQITAAIHVMHRPGCNNGVVCLRL
ncbi:BACK domain-containing protein [Haematococcus lacustris]|uniref:BACK domain-containing protein n=1 Tax=Haematococcus lacustris TaxID=44745 RepID=A0A699YQM5_HAELA|nr:BACK domain-containing protein [Haematococcus lacustris]